MAQAVARRQRRGTRYSTDEERQRHAPAVVPLDPPLEAFEGCDRVVDLDHLELAVQHIGERDEAVDARRVGGEDTARSGVTAIRVALVLGSPVGWERDEGVGRGTDCRVR